MGVLSGLKPELLWKHFEEICNHPHPSKNEGKLAEYIMNFAKAQNLTAIKDDFGNIIIRKPATKGYENLKGIVLQGHIDMVCENNSDVVFDFDNQGIQCYIDGDWVKAKGTTLGADNGIGVATALAILESKELEHGPVEALFTLDEETGLTGAINLGAGLLTGDILINMDSECDGVFTIGCAGGKNTNAKLCFKKEAVPADFVAYNVNLTGLKGGHSGIEIHTGRGNAIKLLSRFLYHQSTLRGARIASLAGGNKHNAIPREAFATIVISKEKESEFVDCVEKFFGVIKNEIGNVEPNLKLEAVKCDAPSYVIDADTQNRLLNGIFAMPHGVLKMSADIAGLVEVSTNLAIIETKEDHFQFITSQRSSVETEKEAAAFKVNAVFTLMGAETEYGDGYPGWQPNVKSPILGTFKEVYRKMYNTEAHIEAIHAGLECGLISEKYPNMDMISYGPTLKDVHCPDEAVQISTVEKFWDLTVQILKNIPVK